MRRYSIILLLACVAAGIVIAVMAAASGSVAPATVTVLNVTELGTTNIVTVEFRRTVLGPRLVEVHRLKLRV